MEPVLADTGPLVALLDKSDKWHDWALRTFRGLRPPLLTCEAVFAETWHLLRGLPRSRKALGSLHQKGVLRVAFDFERESPAVWKLVERYADTPMDFADACLVRMAERYRAARVWTIDSDFSVYRRNGRQAIPLIFPG